MANDPTTIRARELALELASGHPLPTDTTKTIVERAEEYATFLTK